MKVITKAEFLIAAHDEHCRTLIGEIRDAHDPVFLQYQLPAQILLRTKLYPSWRTNTQQTLYIGAYEIPPEKAFPISYRELSRRPSLFHSLAFDRWREYWRTSKVLLFRCGICDVRVVKDGSHRLLQCAVRGISPLIECYEALSNDWSRCTADMKNFCVCSMRCAFVSRAI